MARKKAFDPQSALEKALEAFHAKGFEATSLDDLVKVMDIIPSSLYHTYQNKENLFLDSLHLYQQRSFTNTQAELAKLASPLQKIEKFIALILQDILRDDAQNGCFVMNATTELANRNPQIKQSVKKHIDQILAQLIYLPQMSKGHFLRSNPPCLTSKKGV
ncbi:MAG: hypothetical protein OHK0053_22950 [Microscillaceae bacterium]